MDKVQYVFPEVLKLRETKEGAEAYAAEAKRRGVTVSVLIRTEMRKALGLPPPPEIERKGKAEPGEPQVPAELRENIERAYKTQFDQVAYPGCSLVWAKEEAWGMLERNNLRDPAVLAAIKALRAEFKQR